MDVIKSTLFQYWREISEAPAPLANIPTPVVSIDGKRTKFRFADGAFREFRGCQTKQCPRLSSRDRENEGGTEETRCFQRLFVLASIDSRVIEGERLRFTCCRRIGGC